MLPSRRRRDGGKDDLINGDEEDDEEDEERDFIVDDQGNPIRGARHKRGTAHTIEDEQLREAQDIFGIDYEADEFAAEEYDEDDEEAEFEEYGEPNANRKKRKGDTKKVTIYDAFEPDELIEKYYTDYDKFLREEDEPERFLTRALPVAKVSSKNQLEGHIYRVGHD